MRGRKCQKGPHAELAFGNGPESAGAIERGLRLRRPILSNGRACGRRSHTSTQSIKPGSAQQGPLQLRKSAWAAPPAMAGMSAPTRVGRVGVIAGVPSREDDDLRNDERRKWFLQKFSSEIVGFRTDRFLVWHLFFPYAEAGPRATADPTSALPQVPDADDKRWSHARIRGVREPHI
jgi:hypothetical protein